jgi:hypothetical protein
VLLKTRVEGARASSRVTAAMGARVTGAGGVEAAGSVMALAATLYTTRLLFLQQDANWDLKNYHSYNGWALFNGGLERDLHPAGFQSYLNPLVDVLNYFATSLVPAWAGTGLLLLVQLSSGLLLYAITRHLIPAMSKAAAAAVAILALGGAVTTAEWGTTFGDLTLAPLILASVLVVLGAGRGGSAARHALSGALLGAAVGAKIAFAPLAVGVFVLVLLLQPKSLSAVGSWCGGAAAGLLLIAGPWALYLYGHTGNPFFPLANNVFKSPYYPEVSARDNNYGVHGPIDLALLPFRLADADERLTAEVPFADLRWAMWAISLLLVVGVRVYAKERLRAGASCPTGNARRIVALQLSCLVSFILWASVAGIQRYAVPLEMLLVPVVTASLALILPRRVVRFWLVPVLAVLLGLTTSTANWGRIQMPQGPAIPRNAIPELAAFRGVIVAVPPSAFTAVASASFGERVWLRPPFTEAGRELGMNRLPDGPLAVLTRLNVPNPGEEARRAAAEFDLTITECSEIAAPLADRFLLCAASVPSKAAG